MNQVTITGTTGPGIEVTSQVLTDVTGIRFDLDKRTIFIDHGIITSNYSYDDVSTVTFSISGANTTIVIS